MSMIKVRILQIMYPVRILAVNGKHKASIVKKALEGEVTEDVPSSLLRLHPDITIILDEDAASELELV